jgi:sulfur-oxidizing protein SoxY
MPVLSRRETLAMAAGVAVTAVVGSPGRATATAQDAAAEIANFTGGKAAERGRITIEIPDVVENGNTVPLAVLVDSPMQPDNYVSDVLVIAEGNPRPGVATFRFTPLAGRAEATTRIRLAATQNVIVVAKTSDGKFFTEQKPVTVTIGGCGG